MAANERIGAFLGEPLEEVGDEGEEEFIGQIIGASRTHKTGASPAGGRLFYNDGRCILKRIAAVTDMRAACGEIPGSEYRTAPYRYELESGRTEFCRSGLGT